MNKAHLVGRLVRDPIIRYTQSHEPLCIARFTLAVDRRYKREGEQNADFISCVAFGKIAEHIEKYYYKGMKTILSGRIQTGSYDHKDGYKVYTTDVVIEEMEFAESKKSSDQYQQQNTGFRQDVGYQQQNSGFRQDSGYQQTVGYRQDNNYPHQNNGFRQDDGYQNQNAGSQPQGQNAQSSEQMSIEDDDIPPWFAMIDEDDIPF